MTKTLHHALAISLSITTAACATDDGGEVVVAETQTVLDGIRAGDEVTADGLAVTAPEAGERVAATLDFLDGTHETLLVETLDDGTVVRIDQDAAEPPEDAAAIDDPARAADPCRDEAFRLLGHKWHSVYTYKYSDTVDGTGVSTVDAVHKFDEAHSNVILTRNSCGMRDTIALTSAFGGLTNARPDVTAAGTCARRDRRNVVGWGALPAGVGGVTCVWSRRGRALEADMKLTTGVRMYASEPAGCTSSFSMEAIATHEFGHVFGLGHVGERRHGNLTMSTVINGPCQNSESSLGRGDVMGMRRLY